MTALIPQLINLFAAVILMLAFAMISQRRILSLIHLFTLQGAALVAATLTVGYAPAKSTELRAEIRKDESDQKAFTEGGKTTKDQNSFGLEAVYKF